MATDRVQEILTPEGITLRVTTAELVSRAGAFAIDCMLIAIVLVTLRAVFEDSSGWGRGALQVLSFAIITFYFIWFEIRWRGSTPGKRALGLRVIDARGGPLTADAIFGRNLMRHLEIFVPLVLISDPDILIEGAPSWLNIVSVAWVLVLLAFPLLTRQRVRIGDLVAGTRVVRAPRTTLLDDQGTTHGSAHYRFTLTQLKVYGIFELQVLERLLREHQAPGRESKLVAVCARICQKIQWQGPPPTDAEQFLRDYYRALRDRLERKLLFGERKEDKHHAE